MEKSIIDIILKLLTSDATSSIIILFLIICIFLVWKYVISPIRNDIKKVGIDVSGFFNSNKTEHLEEGICEIKENQRIQTDMAKDLDYIVCFIKNNSGLVDVLKDINKNTGDIVLTRDNLNNINQDLIYLRKFLDRNFDNHKRLSEISNDIKEVVKYIETNKPNINTKFLENSLAIILENIGSQARTKFDK